MQPNIIVFVTDDQPTGMLDAMPVVANEIQAKGVEFVNAVMPTSVCSSSRASFLTGNYAHTHGVYTNDANYHGSWPAFVDNEDLTIATQLQASGYRTSLIGKYINEYGRYSSKYASNYIPPGWTDFMALNGPTGGSAGYYTYDLIGTLPTEHHGREPEDYSTDVIRDKALQTIADTPPNKPLFMCLTPFAPHTPFTPAPRHKGKWHKEVVPEGFNESDVSDKPDYIKALPKVSAKTTKKNIKLQHETLMAVDEMVAAVMAAMADRPNTIFVYMSDNGLMHGVHRWKTKDVPYAGSTVVPMLMRWSGQISPGKEQRIFANVDMTATLATFAGVQWSMDGKAWPDVGRTGCLLEQANHLDHPAYIGWRSKGFLFVEYSEGQGEEFYDYSIDPNELVNRIDDSAYANVIDNHRTKARQQAQPYPPGFVL